MGPLKWETQPTSSSFTNFTFVMLRSLYRIWWHLHGGTIQCPTLTPHWCWVVGFPSSFPSFESIIACTTVRPYPISKPPWEWGLYGPISPSFGQLVFHFLTWTSSMTKYKSRMALWTKLISFYISSSFLQAIKLNYFQWNTFITDYQQIKKSN